MNTSIGLGGLMDIAKMNGITQDPINSSDVLGMISPSSPYLYIPILGPTTFLDLSGFAIDILFSPTKFIPDPVRYSLVGVTVVDAKANWFKMKPFVIGNSPDPYVTIRNGYLQRRAYKINSLKGTEKESMYLTDQIPD